jgi:hypothetical protein
MHLLAVISGEYGQRNVSNIRQHRPSKWRVEVWQAPAELPLIIANPAAYVPPTCSSLLANSKALPTCSLKWRG